MPERLDPITLEVVRNALASTADEMALVLMRSAYSPVVRDTMDYSTALCDRHGKLVAQGLTLAVQLGSFPTMMRHLCAEHAETTRPGDVFIANDPYGYGGQHLPDIYVVEPIFVGGELEGYAATMAHHADVGGIAPGSIAVHATEIFQEGLRLPLLKLYAQGAENEGLLRIVEKNTRQPTQVLGDLQAQVAACRAGAQGLAWLVERYGRDVRRYLERLQETAEAAMRREIAALTDGTYEAMDVVDGFGDEPEPIEIRVTLTIRGDELEIDFTGTSAQVDASLNCPIGLIHAACYCAIRGIVQADIPNCEGYMVPIRVVAPEGTVVNPVLPAACGARGVIGYRVYDAIMRALAQVVPGRVVAAGEGGPTLLALGGYDEDRRPFLTTEVIVGAWGARATLDGLEGVSNPLANLSNQPIELLESDLPVEVTQYRLVPDSGGAGERRGGLAYEREYRVRTERATLTIRSDRRFHPPYGLAGGLPGGLSRNTLIVDGTEHDVPPMPMTALSLGRGDRFRHRSAGGGGFGLPSAREPQAVLEDVRAGKVGVDAAREQYGVVVVGPPWRVDEAATTALRERA